MSVTTTEVSAGGAEDRSTPVAEANEPAQETTPWSQRLKYGLVKCASTAGLSFLTPFVLLAYGEEPLRQLKDITRLVIAPMIAFGVFLYLWTVIAPMHKTKSGEVPTPAVVWDAAQSIWTFHEREGEKELAYAATGDEREAQVGALNERLTKVRTYEKAVQSLVAKREIEADAWTKEQTAEITKQLEERQAEHQFAQQAREVQLKSLADGLAAGDTSGKEKYLTSFRKHLSQTEIEQTELAHLNDQRDELLEAKYPPLQAAKSKLNELAEERQHLTALTDQLQRANRGLKMEAEIKRLKNSQRRLLAAEDGDEVADLAQQVVLSEKRIQSVADSNYAKPWTLPMQIQRSVACAFCGFLIGAVIAIPIGVLCGLSPTFMSAMTPFIALFKPVSPIVWLPIALIVVGGFIPDPDEHWLIGALANAPLIGWMKINPAFMASAITVALCSLWATMVNTALGVSSVDQDHLNVARVLRLGFWSRLFKIVIPSSLPLIFAGLRISLGVGWMVLIAGELLSSSEGIGKFVWDQFNNGASDSFAKMIVVVFVVGLIGLLLDRVMIILQRLVSFDDAAAAL